MKLSKLVKLLLALMIAIPFPALVYNMGNKAHAVTATDPAPFIPHKGDYKGKVLFDNTHGETAGAADWVIDGGFSDFANAIADQGYDVKELRKTTPITYDDLKDYNVFVLGEANIPFKASEQAAMLQYVQDGGSIFFIGDHYNSDRNLNRWDSGEVYNGFRRGAWDDPTKGMSVEEANSSAMQGVTSSDWLGQNFGIRFRSNALGDVTSGETVVSPNDSFGITEGVTTVEMHAGSTLAILDPTKAKGLIYMPKNPPKWDPAVDQGVYDGGGIAEGAFAAIAKVGKGKAAFIGDSSPVEDPTTKYLREDNGQKKTTFDGFLGEGQDAVFLTNTIKWLAQQEDYTSFEGKIPLSSVTQLYDWELPQNTTEPEHEPWSEPPTGYKWWDPTTFANGSYGSPVDPTLQPTYRFIHGAIPSTGQFDLTISVDNLSPNQTLTDLNVGMYLDGGLQVAEFQNPDGTWPSSYGYSSHFTMTADDTGHASISLKGQIRDNTNAVVYIKLRQGKNQVYKDSIIVGDVKPMTIQQARDKGTGTVSVEGIITTTPGIWGAKGFYLQDDTGGIYVYQSDNGFKLGDKVKIIGSLSTYNGELELSNQKAEILGQSDLPKPKVVTTVDDTNQGQLLQLQDATIENISDPDRYNSFDVIVLQGASNNAIQIHVDSRSGVNFDNFKYHVGDVLDITGIGSIFRGTYQLKPRSADDFNQAPVIGDLDPLSIMQTDAYQQTVIVTDDKDPNPTVAITLDGETISNPITIDPLQLALGDHVIHVTATDNEGKMSERTFVLHVDFDVDHLDELLAFGEGHQLVGQLGHSLESKVNAIQNTPNEKAQANQLAALRNEISAQAGKKINQDFAQTFITDIDYLSVN